MRGATNRLTGKLTLAIVAIVLTAAGLLWTTGTLATWWQRSTRDALLAEIERLQGELPILQARASFLKRPLSTSNQPSRCDLETPTTPQGISRGRHARFP